MSIFEVAVDIKPSDLLLLGESFIVFPFFCDYYTGGCRNPISTMLAETFFSFGAGDFLTCYFSKLALAPVNKILVISEHHLLSWLFNSWV